MKTITITGGKGGTGKTTFSANLAVALSKYGRNVVVFDADLALANLDLVMGVRAEYTLTDVLSGSKTLREVIVRGPAGVGIIAGGSGIANLMRAGPKRLNTFLSQLTELESWVDDLVFDTSSGIDNRVVTFATAADINILLTTPDPAAVTDAYAVSKVLWKKQPDMDISVVVNKVRTSKVGDAVWRSLADVVHQYLSKDLHYLGCVHDDPLVRDCVRHRVPFVEVHPEIQAAKDIMHVAKAVRAKCDKSTRPPLSERMFAAQPTPEPTEPTGTQQNEAAA